jgi:hypothetical protein
MKVRITPYGESFSAPQHTDLSLIEARDMIRAMIVGPNYCRATLWSIQDIWRDGGSVRLADGTLVDVLPQ